MDSRLDGREFDSPQPGGQTTSVLHQATQTNSASYPQRNGNEYGQSAVMLCGWGVKAGMAHCTCG